MVQGKRRKERRKLETKNGDIKIITEKEIKAVAGRKVERRNKVEEGGERREVAYHELGHDDRLDKITSRTRASRQRKIGEGEPKKWKKGVTLEGVEIQ